MKEALDFVKHFAEADNIARIAKWTEKDDEVFNRKLAELNDCYGKDLSSEINRPVPLDDKGVQEGKQYLKNYQQAKIFMLQKFEDASLYAAYLSSYYKGSNTYFLRIYFTNNENKWKIISQYSICQTCNGTGTAKGKECEECGGVGWIWEGGINQDLQKVPVEVLKVQPPENPVHLREYESA